MACTRFVPLALLALSSIASAGEVPPALKALAAARVMTLPGDKPRAQVYPEKRSADGGPSPVGDAGRRRQRGGARGRKRAEKGLAHISHKRHRGSANHLMFPGLADGECGHLKSDFRGKQCRDEYFPPSVIAEAAATLPTLFKRAGNQTKMIRFQTDFQVHLGSFR